MRYILAPHGADPFTDTVLSRAAVPDNRAYPLLAGQAFTGIFPAQRIEAGRVASFGVLVGTYGGAANGHLTVSLCADQACTEGAVDLAGAPDNGILQIPLAAPLDVVPGTALRYRIAHADGGEAVALWLSPDASLAPQVALTYAGLPVPPRVYADDLVDIYELPHPKPYFETRGGCTLTYFGTDAGRETLTADCRAPATLVRRELAYPGWHATSNGEAVPVGEVEPLFQAIRLPAGVSHVRFRYWPPCIGWAYAAALLGLTGLSAGCWPGRRPSAKRPA